MNTMKTYLTTSEVARRLGKNPVTIIRWAKDPTHPLEPFDRVGEARNATYLFLRSDVEQLEEAKSA